MSALNQRPWGRKSRLFRVRSNFPKVHKLAVILLFTYSHMFPTTFQALEGRKYG